MSVWDDDLCDDVIVEEVVLVEGMDLSRVETGMQFPDNHNTWDLNANLGRVSTAVVEEIEGTGPAVLTYTKSGQSFEVVSYRLPGDGMCRLSLQRRNI